ncbi:hypothetical protein BGX26_007959, partial [Mortierella sp. AD094]
PLADNHISGFGTVTVTVTDHPHSGDDLANPPAHPQPDPLTDSKAVSADQGDDTDGQGAFTDSHGNSTDDQLL